jgi:hypothetical protein
MAEETHCPLETLEREQDSDVIPVGVNSRRPFSEIGDSIPHFMTKDCGLNAMVLRAALI